MAEIRFRNSQKKLYVGKILCLGRNYAEHAREMKTDVPAVPVVFMKPATALVHDGEEVIPLPFSHNVHFEAEMVIVIGRRAKNVPAERSHEYVGGYAVGLDMTLRDVQDEAKSKGLPWTVAKGFDTSAPVSDAVESEAVVNPNALSISLKVNGEVRQHSNTEMMIFKVHDIVSYLSTIFTLEPGDLIFTGTPEGVGKVEPGDHLEAELEDVGTLQVKIRRPLEEQHGTESWQG